MVSSIGGANNSTFIVCGEVHLNFALNNLAAMAIDVNAYGSELHLHQVFVSVLRGSDMSHMQRLNWAGALRLLRSTTNPAGAQTRLPQCKIIIYYF